MGRKTLPTTNYLYYYYCYYYYCYSYYYYFYYYYLWHLGLVVMALCTSTKLTYVGRG